MQVFLIHSDTQPSPRWTEAFPDARIIRDSHPSDVPAGTEMCWIGADLPDWPARVRERARTHRVVVHSRRPHDDEGIAAFDAGAHGYCHSLANAAQLRAVASTVAGGGLWVGPGLMARMIRTVRRAQPDPERPPAGFERLTAREREVALAVTTGASNKEIARQLGMTERTVKMHLGSVFRKLQVHDRVQLVLHLTGAERLSPA